MADENSARFGPPTSRSQSPTMDTEEQREQQEAVARLKRAAMFSVDIFVLDNYQVIKTLTNAQRTSLIVEAAIAYLLGTDLIRCLTADQWPDLISVGIPEHLQPDISGAANEAARLRRAALTAELP